MVSVIQFPLQGPIVDVAPVAGFVDIDPSEGSFFSVRMSGAITLRLSGAQRSGQALFVHCYTVAGDPAIVLVPPAPVVSFGTGFASVYGRTSSTFPAGDFYWLFQFAGIGGPGSEYIEGARMASILPPP